MENTEKNTEQNNTPEVSKNNQNPNKITFLEIFVLVLLIFCIWLYISPNFLVKLENRQNAKVQTNAAIFTSKALSEFSLKNSAHKGKPSAISEKIIKELNAVNKNPHNKKQPAYSIQKRCEGCVIVIPDDKMNSITVEAYTADDILLVRTIIQPPSFVTFTKDLKELEKDNKKPAKKNKEVRNNGK